MAGHPQGNDGRKLLSGESLVSLQCRGYATVDLIGWLVLQAKVSQVLPPLRRWMACTSFRACMQLRFSADKLAPLGS